MKHVWSNGIYIYIYIYISVCVFVSLSIYFISHYIYYFWLGWLFVFVSIKSNSFDVKSDDFCLLQIWIYELLLINIKQRSVQQYTVSNHELPYEFLSGTFYCLSHATLAVDINVETLEENGILLSQFTQNVVEAHFLRNIAGWYYLLGNWFKIQFLEIWLYFYVTFFP